MNRIKEEIHRISELSETELAYIAGFVDADGSISMHKASHGNSVTADIAIYNTDRDTLSWIADRLVSTQRMELDRELEWKTEGVLRVRREKDIITTLEALIPFLVTKEEQAKNTVEMLKFKNNRENYHLTEEQQETRKDK